jgi:hypothetical protein
MFAAVPSPSLANFIFRLPCSESEVDPFHWLFRSIYDPR